MLSLAELAEKFLVAGCKVFFCVVMVAAFIHKIIMKVLGFIMSFVIMIYALAIIYILPLYWQSIVLSVLMIGGAASFACIVALRTWKPEKFFFVFYSVCGKK